MEPDLDLQEVGSPGGAECEDDDNRQYETGYDRAEDGLALNMTKLLGKRRIRQATA
jgi:hypothetical protein